MASPDLASAASAPAAPTVCPNCDSPVSGNFCSTCGQRNVPLRLTLRQLFGDFVGDWLHLDSKLFRTFWRLLSAPGALTADYLAGKRERYIRPFKVYLAASVLYFSFFALHPPPAHVQNGAAKKGSGRTQLGVVIETSPQPSEHENEFERRLGDQIRKDPEAVSKRITHALTTQLPRAMFLLVPFFAALLRLLYVRQDWLYVEHFIFSLHLHAFAFAVFLAEHAVSVRLGEDLRSAAVLIASLAVVVVYLVMAMRRVYGQSLPLTVAKVMVLGLCYLTVMTLVLSGIVMAELYFGGS